MQTNFATRLTSACIRFARPVILVVVLIAAGSGFYASRHFAISTDVDRLMPASLPWVQREHAYEQAFPLQQIVAELRAPTPELVGDAAHRLADALRNYKATITAVEQPQSDPYLLRAGLGGLTQAQSLLAELAAVPTLRGALEALAPRFGSPDGRRSMTINSPPSPPAPC